MVYTSLLAPAGNVPCDGCYVLGDSGVKMTWNRATADLHEHIAM